MLDSIKKSLAALESSLIIWYRPSFLHITTPDEDNDFQIVISSEIFLKKSVQERIQMIMSTIDVYHQNLFEDRLIIIQAYTPDEMDEIIEYVFDDDESNPNTEGV